MILNTIFQCVFYVAEHRMKVNYLKNEFEMIKTFMFNQALDAK